MKPKLRKLLNEHATDEIDEILDKEKPCPSTRINASTVEQSGRKYARSQAQKSRRDAVRLARMTKKMEGRSSE